MDRMIREACKLLQICCNKCYTIARMDDSLELFSTILRQRHYRVTTVRRAVFCALYQHGPCTMRQLTEYTAMADRVSVYRCVELFEQLGIAQRLPIGWKYQLELTDVFIRHHHHATCRRCGRVIDIAENEEIERLIAAIAQAHHLAEPSHTFEIQGICPRCQRPRQAG